MKAAASLRHPSKTTLPYRGGGGGGGGGGGKGEGVREVRLDDRMAAFTQRVVSPAETRFQRSAQQSHRSFSPPINIRACEVSASFSPLWVCFALLYFDETSLGSLPCPLPMDRPRQSRRTKRIKPRQRTASPSKQIQGFSSVSTRDNHLASSLVFLVVRLPCA